MYIKLTRLDGTPIWLNAAFIVTIEPRRQGGSIVVPIGDGLDYDVKENVNDVLAMLQGSPVPTVVPVPAPQMLAPTHVGTVPEKEAKMENAKPAEKQESVAEVAQPASEEVAEAKPKARRTKAKAKSTTTAKKTSTTTKKTTRTRKTKTKAKTAEDAKVAEAMFEEPKPEEPQRASTALTDEQIARLVRMSPRTTKKVTNTLVAQFKDPAPEETIKALQERGLITLDQTRVIWMTPAV